MNKMYVGVLGAAVIITGVGCWQLLRHDDSGGGQEGPRLGLDERSGLSREDTHEPAVLAAVTEDASGLSVTNPGGSQDAATNNGSTYLGMISEIASNTVDSSHIRWHAIEGVDIDSSSVTSRTIKNGTIEAKDLDKSFLERLLEGSGTTGSSSSSLFVTDDSLDFAEFSDTMTLDASTDVAITGTNVFSFTNTGTGNSLVVNDASGDMSPFVIDAAGNIGAGASLPARKLEILETDSAPQMRLSKSGSVYADFLLDGAGDLKFVTTGGDVRVMSENLWVCDNDGCPTVTPTGQGNIIVENAQIYSNSFSTKRVDDTSIGVYDSLGNLIMSFEEGL